MSVTNANNQPQGTKKNMGAKPQAAGSAKPESGEGGTPNTSGNPKKP